MEWNLRIIDTIPTIIIIIFLLNVRNSISINSINCNIRALHSRLAPHQLTGAVYRRMQENTDLRRPCSDFTDMLRRLTNCRIIIIIFSPRARPDIVPPAVAKLHWYYNACRVYTSTVRYDNLSAVAAKYVFLIKIFISIWLCACADNTYSLIQTQRFTLVKSSG